MRAKRIFYSTTLIKLAFYVKEFLFPVQEVIDAVFNSGRNLKLINQFVTPFYAD